MSALDSGYRFFNQLEGGLTRFFDGFTRRDLWLYAVAAGLIYVLAGTTNFSGVLREDAYNFVIKGMEIANGDFSLDRAQALGWPLVLGLVYAVMDVEDVFEGMYIARWASIVCIALAAVVLGRACSAVLPAPQQKGMAVAIVLAFATTSLLYFAARSAMTEPLFLLTVVAVVLFAARSVEQGRLDLRNLVAASVCAGLSYYARPNGLFVLAGLLALVTLSSYRRPRQMLVGICVAIFSFILVTSPYLYARYIAFGSPFDYGPNSKYFVEHYEQVWAENVATPSLWEFLTSHTGAELYHRFVDRGLFAVIEIAGEHLLPDIWVVLAVAGGIAIFVLGRQRAYVVPLILLVSIAGLSMVYSIFGSIRHLFFFIPLLLLCAGAVLFVVERARFPFQNLVAVALIAFVVSHPPSVTWMDPSTREIPQVKDHWAVWIANHARGKVAIVEGGDLLKMSQHYEPLGWRVARKFVDVVPRIQAWRPGIYESLDQAVAEFERLGVDYLVTDPVHIKRRPYLRDVTRPEWRDTFQHLKYFQIGDRGSQLFDVNVYRIVY